ncbi:hypothetical protein ABE527_14280 [Brucella sp. TWI432]
MSKIGDNSKLTPGEYDALLMDRVRKELAYQAEIDAINVKRKADRKQTQSYGITLGELDFTCKTLQAEDKDKVLDAHRRRSNILALLKLAPAQGDLFTDSRPYIDQVFDQGKVAGLAAKDRTSEFMDGSDEDQAWLRGYDEGQSEARENLRTAMEKLNAASEGDSEDDGGDEE